jgi:(1->4)-alpha-D-glucan 1-alpha-D-glucosylmutase
MGEGLPKLWLIRQGLRLRREAADVRNGGYAPIPAAGERAVHALGFLRGETVAVVVPRLVMTLGGRWADTRVPLPRGRWRNVLTGDDYDGGEAALEHLLHVFPEALLHREDHK